MYGKYNMTIFLFQANFLDGRDQVSLTQASDMVSETADKLQNTSILSDSATRINHLQIKEDLTQQLYNPSTLQSGANVPEAWDMDIPFICPGRTAAPRLSAPLMPNNGV